MKRVLIMLLSAILAAFTGCNNSTNKGTVGDSGQGSAAQTAASQTGFTAAVPDEYKQTADQQGEVVELEYDSLDYLRDRVFLAQAQKMHMLCAYWGFVFLSLHLGLHWSNILNMSKRFFKKRSPVRSWAVRIFGWAAAAYGIYAFFKRNFPEYMFLKIHFVYFDLSEPLIFYLADYLAVMVTFVCAGYYLSLILKRAGKRDEQKV